LKREKRKEEKEAETARKRAERESKRLEKENNKPISKRRKLVDQIESQATQPVSSVSLETESLTQLENGLMNIKCSGCRLPFNAFSIAEQSKWQSCESCDKWFCQLCVDNLTSGLCEQC